MAGNPTRDGEQGELSRQTHHESKAEILRHPGDGWVCMRGKIYSNWIGMCVCARGEIMWN